MAGELGVDIVQTHQHNISTSASTPIDWSIYGGFQKIYVTVVTSDIYIAFNQTANTDSFRIIAGSQPAAFELTGSNVKTISLLAVSGTNDVYVMGVKT